MRGWGTWGVALALALVVGIGGGCRKRGPQPGDDELGRAGLGETDLSGRSSVERARAGLPPEEDGILGDVRFGYDSAEVDSAGRAVLTRNIEWLRANPGPKVELEGHADSRGTIEYNLALGARRAKAVKDHLVAHGIPADRISTISYGKELPLCHEESESCWARNRRVHSVVFGQ